MADFYLNKIMKLAICENCINSRNISLFDKKCLTLNQEISSDSGCEMFDSDDKKINYQINKLSQAIMDSNGVSDYLRMQKIKKNDYTCKK